MTSEKEWPSSETVLAVVVKVLLGRRRILRAASPVRFKFFFILSSPPLVPVPRARREKSARSCLLLGSFKLSPPGTQNEFYFFFSAATQRDGFFGAALASRRQKKNRHTCGRGS